MDEQTLRTHKLYDVAGRHGPLTREELKDCVAIVKNRTMKSGVPSFRYWLGVGCHTVIRVNSGPEPLIRMIRKIRRGGKNLDPVDAFALFNTAHSMYRRYLECLDTLRQEMELRSKTAFSRSQVGWLLFRPGAWRNHVASTLKT